MHRPCATVRDHFPYCRIFPRLKTAKIDTFLMSCRVIGRKVEDRILDKAAELLKARGFHKMIGEFIPTRKNALVNSFYEGQRFTPVQELPDGTRLYERAI